MNVPTTIKSPSRILASALALGWAFDLLFYGQLPGLSVVLFILLIVATLVSLTHLDGIAPRRPNLWLLVPLFFFASMVAIRANPYLNAINILACLILLAFLAYFYSAGRLDRLGLAGYNLSFIVAGFNAIFRAIPLIPASIDSAGIKSRGKDSARVLLPVLRGLILALPVAIVFVVLLASSDVIFANWVGALLDIPIPDLRETFWHVALVLFVAWILAGGLAFAIARSGADDGEPWETVLDTIPKVIHIGFIEGSIILTVVNGIFMAFGWIQVTYLFGGPANITLEGYTYADYARRGFFELVAVSILTMGLILGLNSFTWRESRLQNIVFKSLATMMVALTGVLLASAFSRMWLYEEAYGFTHLRLIVHIFEVWLAVLFVWLVITMWAVPRRFALGAFVAVLGFLATLNLINLDSTIAEQNLARYKSIGRIDIYFLDDLSEDAIPTLLSKADSLSPGDRSWLLSDLGRRLGQMESDKNWMGIPSFNLARWQAYTAMRESALLAQYTQPAGATDSAEPTYLSDDWER